MLDPGEYQERDGTFTTSAATLEELPESVQFAVDVPAVRAELLPVVTETPGPNVFVRRFPFRLAVRSASNPGVGNATVTATTSFRDGRKDVARASCVWNTRSLYEVTPGQAFFAAPKAADPVSLERIIELRRADGRALRVGNVEKHEAILCEVTQTEPSCARLHVRVDPAKFGDVLWHELIVETDHPKQPQLQLTVSAVKE